MLRTAAWLAVMAAMTTAWGQDPPTGEDKDCKRGHEIEDRRGVCCTNGKPNRWDGYDKGVVWERSVQAAMARAKKERRLVMLWHLVGDADLEGC